MKRKTNLFYTTGTDSNFITFSNYTEAMTGNFLATDVKLFPSKFLCLNIPSLTQSNKEEFIKLLAAYYENKLAFLRDKCSYNGYDIEKKIKPLGWLLDFIYNYDESFSIEYAGQITEQDYNGIYADTICIIDSTDCSYAVVERDGALTSYEDYNQSQNYLYGWYDVMTDTSQEIYNGPSQYQDVSPITEEGKYYYDSVSSNIEIIHPDSFRDIQFNVIIPLFDIININYKENTDIIKSFDHIDLTLDSASIIDVPYGMWFAKGTITLSRDGTQWSPSWSLAIGSQFKPFPYSETPISEVSNSTIAASFMTFAQALIRQNKMMDKISDVSRLVNELSTRITTLQAQVNNIGTMKNIDDLHEDIAYLTSYMSTSLNNMQNEIDRLYA